MYGEKGQLGGLINDNSTYQAVEPITLLAVHGYITQVLQQLLTLGCFQGEARDFTFAEVATDPVSDVRVTAAVLDVAAAAGVRIFCSPGLGRAGSPPNASAALPTPEDALWKTGAAVLLSGLRFGRVGTAYTARD